jgi:hypothetical protein
MSKYKSVTMIDSERASIYLQQLCKHFAHKRPVEFTPEKGEIAFAIGTCRLSANGSTLELGCESDDAEQLAHLEDLIARHLLRFAFRNPPEIKWQTASTA